MIPFYAENNRVQKWFWFYFGDSRTWATYEYSYNIFRFNEGTPTPGEFNEMGTKYLELAEAYKDEILPVVSVMPTLTDLLIA